MPGTWTYVTEIPRCDFCSRDHVSTPAYVDGRTVYGPWANMCEAHWRVHGVGQLGVGNGQELRIEPR